MSELHVKSKRTVCPVCMRAQRTCICDLVLPVAHDTEVLILQHPLEVHQAKGTARLLHLCLPHSRIVIGEQFDAAALHSLLYHPWPHVPSQAQTSIPVQAVLLYPDTTEEAEMTAAPAKDVPKRCRLVILDGTWRKSRKMLHLNPLLTTLPRLSFADPVPSCYQIRKAHRPQQLSTLEAACHALTHLEGDAERFQPLLNAFTKFVARHMHYMRSAGNEKNLREE